MIHSRYLVKTTVKNCKNKTFSNLTNFPYSVKRALQLEDKENVSSFIMHTSASFSTTDFRSEMAFSYYFNVY